MLDRIEFYNCPDGSINIKPFDEAMYPFDSNCRNIIEEMIVLIKDIYPAAFAALSELYSKSERNRDFFEYKIVHRFIRCNFGEYDALSFDIGADGSFNVEDVKCPLRGECLWEGVICKPKMQTKLTEREHQVALLLSQGLTRQEVADDLGISVYTVLRHIANIKMRMHFRHTNQIIAHFNGKNQ